MTDITGIWVAESDTGLYLELFISPAGTGWFEYARTTYAVISEFTWRHSQPNQISFEYGENREVDEDGVTFTWSDDPGSYSYELIEGGVLRFAPPYRGNREFRRGRRNSPFQY